MARDPSHWLVEDDYFQGDYPLSEDDEGFHNEFNPEGFDSYDDEDCYEILVP